MRESEAQFSGAIFFFLVVVVGAVVGGAVVVGDVAVVVSISIEIELPKE